MSIRTKMIKCLQYAGFSGVNILKVLCEPNTENEYLVIFEDSDKRIRKSIIIGNEAGNCFDYKFSL